ncbi:MAG: L-lysine 6-transaminase [Calditrichaceae bacterium]
MERILKRPDSIIEASRVHEILKNYMLIDGFDFVVDLDNSKDSYLVDKTTGKKYIDFFTYFASAPLGHNPDGLLDEEFLERLKRAAINKPSNSDLYTTEMAAFVETFSKVVKPDYMKHLFFVDGGALAVENALKASFDWKVRLNKERGLGEEKGYQVIHFKRAFHGRSGYTLSLTNTFDPNKIKYFPKFNWPRITSPFLQFPVTDEALKNVINLEKQAVREIEEAVKNNPHDIAALIIEPVQGEGGDNHFRPEFFKELRRLADQYEFMFIVDEVQSGMGLTGKMWAHEWYDVKPDMICFGKKTQICGFMSTDRIDMVTDNVFRVSSRINSTWGGNLTDMVRSQRYLEVIRDENLVRNAADKGAYFKGKLDELSGKFNGLVTNVRGKGLMLAFDLADTDTRNRFIKKAQENGLIVLKCGEKSVRFRPALNVTDDVIDDAVTIVIKTLEQIFVVLN